MKRVLLVLLVASIFFLIFSSSVRAGPLYFGYFDGFRQPWGTGLGTDRYGSYANTVIDANRVGGSPSDVANAYIANINQLSPIGIKPIIEVAGIFFGWANGGTHGRHAYLLPDYQTRWSQFWQVLSPYRAKILGFYPIDEPSAWLTCNEFTVAANTIRASAPELSILELIDAPAMQGWTKDPREGWLNSGGDFCIPPSVNWLAMDHYCWNNSDCLGAVEKEDGFLNTIAIYRPLPDGSKRSIFVIPEAYSNSGTVPDQTYQQNLISMNQWYYNLCGGLSQCIGIIPFVWTHNADSAGMSGVADMPILENYLKTNIAAKIVNKASSSAAPTFKPTAPTPHIEPPTPGDVNQDGRVDINDLRALVANFTSIFIYNNIVANYGK